MPDESHFIILSLYIFLLASWRSLSLEMMTLSRAALPRILMPHASYHAHDAEADAYAITASRSAERCAFLAALLPS